MSERRGVEMAAVPEVAAFFGVPAPDEIVPARFGLANHNYIFRTSRGDYVARFLVNQAPELVANDVAIQRQLRRAGVTAPHYLRSAGGAYLYQRDDLYAVVAPRIEGITPHHMGVPLAADVGRNLALFHTSVRSLPNPSTGGLMNPAVARVESGARRLLDQDLPRGIIHGDLHGGNVLVDPACPDRVAALLDFEEAGVNLFIIDLAVTLLAASAPADGEVIVPEFRDAVRKGYESVRRLTDEEAVWLPEAIRYAGEAWVNWFEANGCERYARRHHRHHRRCQSLCARNP